jgi:hypothetical protein
MKNKQKKRYTMRREEVERGRKWGREALRREEVERRQRGTEEGGGREEAEMRQRGGKEDTFRRQGWGRNMAETRQRSKPRAGDGMLCAKTIREHVVAPSWSFDTHIVRFLSTFVLKPQLSLFLNLFWYLINCTFAAVVSERWIKIPRCYLDYSLKKR